MVKIILLPQRLFRNGYSHNKESQFYNHYSSYQYSPNECFPIEVDLPSIPQFGDLIDLEDYQQDIYASWCNKVKSAITSGQEPGFVKKLRELAADRPKYSEKGQPIEVLGNLIFGNEDKGIDSIFLLPWIVMRDGDNYNGAFFCPKQEHIFLNIEPQI